MTLKENARLRSYVLKAPCIGPLHRGVNMPRLVETVNRAVGLRVTFPASQPVERKHDFLVLETTALNI